MRRSGAESDRDKIICHKVLRSSREKTAIFWLAAAAALSDDNNLAGFSQG